MWKSDKECGSTHGGIQMPISTFNKSGGRYQRVMLRLFAGVLYLFPLIFIFQGLDWTDSGYILTSSRDMLADPTNVPAFAYPTFLSMFLNGAWMKLTSPLGLVGARLGVVAIFWMIFTIAYFVLKDFMPKWQVILWLVLTFLNTTWYFWISYNNITALLALSSLAFIYFGYKCNTRAFFFVAGILCGLNLFARFPNVLMLVFGLIPLAMKFFPASGDKRVFFKESLLFYAGWMCSVVCMIILMKIAGYWTLYASALGELRRIAGDSASHHSGRLLFNLFVRDHKRVLAFGFLSFSIIRGLWIASGSIRMFAPFQLLCSGYVAFSLGWNRYNSRFLLPTSFWVVLLLLFVFQAALDGKIFLARPLLLVNDARLRTRAGMLINTVGTGALLFFLVRYLGGKSLTVFDILFGITYIVSMLSLVESYRRRDSVLFLVVAASLLLFLTVPLGSNNGIRNGTHGLWLALPLTLHWIWERSVAYARNVSRSGVYWFGAAMVVFLLLMGGTRAYRYTYRDTVDRLAMRCPIDHPKLRFQYTTAQRADVVQQLLDRSKEFIRAGDYVLGYHTISLFYYLTDTKPYLYSSWPFLYSPEQLRETLQRVQRERPGLPVAVRSKYSLQNFEWPMQKFTNKSDLYQTNLRILGDFLREKGYRTVWENEYFEILLPPSSKATK